MKLCIPIAVRPKAACSRSSATSPRGSIATACPTRSRSTTASTCCLRTRGRCRVRHRGARETPPAQSPDRASSRRLGDGLRRQPGLRSHAGARQPVADVTIFQSEYSRYSTREKYHVVAQDGPVIWNPVDLDAFDPTAPGSICRPVRRGSRARRGVSTRPRGPADRRDCRRASGRDVRAVRHASTRSPIAPTSCAWAISARDSMAASLRSCDVFLNLLAERSVSERRASKRWPAACRCSICQSGGVPEARRRLWRGDDAASLEFGRRACARRPAGIRECRGGATRAESIISRRTSSFRSTSRRFRTRRAASGAIDH